MDELLNQIEQRQVLLGRLAAGLLKDKSKPALLKAYRVTRRILLESGPITSVTKLKKVTAEIRREVIAISAASWAEITKDLEDIAVYDTGIFTETLIAALLIGLKTPEKEKLINGIDKSIISLKQGQRIDAGTWQQFTGAFSDSVVERFNSIVSYSYNQGETPEQAASQIGIIAGGALLLGVEALIRTGLQHYTEQARKAMFSANAGELNREYPIVTFDSRTSATCRGIRRDYKAGWPVGKSPIGYPPYHWNCRTIVVALPGKARVGDIKEAEQPKDGETIYDSWLKNQPAGFIEATLGSKSAELFQAGKLSIGQFNDLSGRPLTLAQLRALDGG